MHSAVSAPPLAAPPVVGRDAVLDRLSALLGAVENDAESGAVHAALVIGEAGVGKSRVASELARIARARGFRVAMGAANAVERDLSYSLAADMLAPLLASLEPAVLDRLTRGRTAALASIFPTLDHPARERTDFGDAADDRTRAFWTLGQLLTALSARAPLLLIADNLQWADRASLELLHYLARTASGRTLLVGTWTTDESAPTSAWAAAQRSALSLGFAEVIRLVPLSAADVTALVSALFDVAAPTITPFAALLYGWTRGNPLFIREVLQTLIDHGDLYLRDGTWHGWGVQALVLPRTIRDTLGGRIAMLSPGARAVAAIVAVSGVAIPHERLGRIAALDEESLLHALDELRRRGMLAERSDADIRYDLAHPLLRDVLLADLGAARVRRLHLTIAEAALADATTTGVAAEEIASHVLHAAAAPTGRRFVDVLVAAGESALTRHASSDAARFLAAALESLPADDGEIERVLVLLARARQRGGEYEAAARLWTELRDRAHARADAEAAAVASFRLARVLLWRGDHDAALTDFAQALAAATGDALVARILIARAACLQEIGRASDAAADLTRATELADRLDDARLQLRAARGTLMLYAWSGPAKRAREAGERALQIAESLGDRSLLWSARWAMGVLAGLTGDSPGVAHHLAECEAIADALGSPSLSLATTEVAIEYASGTGAWSDGLAHAERAIALARALDASHVLPRLLVWSALILLGRGEVAQAKLQLDEAWTLSEADDLERAARRPHHSIPAHTGLAAYWLALGDHAQAIAVAERGLALADRTGYVVWGVHRLLPILGEAALWAGDFERAATLTRRMRRDAARLEHRLGLVWADACDALLVLLHDREPARALPRLAAAAEALEAVPLPEYAARVRRQVASAAYDLGDLTRARRELRRAHDLLAPMHAEGVLAGIREQLREYGVRPPAVIPPPERELTGREAQIAKLVAAHRSNAQIGTALGISARTVSTHLTNIFAKLGVASRAELADRVRVSGARAS